MKYRPEIDGLRAVAVGAVIAHHFDKQFLPYGYLGVDIFFVISGFVIAASLLRQSKVSLGEFLFSFYSRRIRRLIPALLFVAALSSIFVCIFHPDPQESILTGITSLFGLSNLFLLNRSADYFAASTELNAFTHTWSLGVEEQFYFVMPIITYLLLIKQATRNSVRSYALLIGSLALGSWLLYSHIYSTHQSIAYFSMPSRFWELAAGCLTFLVVNSKRQYSLLRSFPSTVLLALLIIALSLPQTIEGPVFRVSAVVILTSIFILAVKPGSLAFSILASKYFVFVGLISYSLYLWHWPVLALSRLTVGIHPFTIPIQLLLMFGLAILTYFFVESRFRHGSETRGLRPIPQALLAVLAVSGFMFFLGYKGLNRLYIGKLLNVDYPVWIRRPWFAGKAGIGIDNCAITEVTSERIRECFLAKNKSSTTAYVIGDSHARNYVPAVQALFGIESVRYFTVGSECSFSPPSMQRRYHGGSIDECLGYVNFVADFLKANARYGDIVFVGQRLFVDYDKERQSDLYFNHLLALSRSLAPNRIPVVLLDGTRPPRKIPQECYPLPWKPFVANSDGCNVARKIVESDYLKFDSLAKGLQRAESNFFYAPLRSGLCDGDVCGQFMASGTPIWRDMGHITDAASRELWLLLRSKLIDQKIRERFPSVLFKSPE